MIHDIASDVLLTLQMQTNLQNSHKIYSPQTFISNLNGVYT